MVSTPETINGIILKYYLFKLYEYVIPITFNIAFTVIDSLYYILYYSIKYNKRDIKNILNNNIKYFQFLCLNDGCYEFGLLFFVINNNTINTNDI